jgi:hypothetical protein
MTPARILFSDLDAHPGQGLPDRRFLFIDPGAQLPETRLTFEIPEERMVTDVIAGWFASRNRCLE